MKNVLSFSELINNKVADFKVKKLIDAYDKFLDNVFFSCLYRVLSKDYCRSTFILPASCTSMLTYTLIPYPVCLSGNREQITTDLIAHPHGIVYAFLFPFIRVLSIKLFLKSFLICPAFAPSTHQLKIHAHPST